MHHKAREWTGHAQKNCEVGPPYHRQRQIRELSQRDHHVFFERRVFETNVALALHTGEPLFQRNGLSDIAGLRLLSVALLFSGLLIDTVGGGPLVDTNISGMLSDGARRGLALNIITRLNTTRQLA